uniref:Uncharacterized protein n=1 Tax=Anopheles coluzzii TaxID=1518534 RepID=A0A8W7PSX2_ANOCL
MAQEQGGAHEKRTISRSLTAISTATATTAAITTAGTTTATATAHWAMIARATARAATVLLTVEPPPPRGTRPRRLPPKLRLLVISSRKPGISCPVSASRRTSPFATLRFFSLKKEVAVPRLPIRPVRPMRCTYSSTSAGRSKLITCFTFGMSSPRAATAVATRIGQRPQRNRRSASSRSACLGDVRQQIEQMRALDVFLHPEDRLRNVDRGRADAPDRQEDVAVQEVARQLLDRLREGGGEHERLPFARHRHAALLDDAPDLRLEAHVQHAVGFVQHQEADVVQPDLAAPDHVLQPTGRRHDQVAAALEIAHLVLRVVAAVQYGRAHARPVAELLRLLEDLRCQLAGRRQHQPERVLLAPVHRPVRGRRGRPVLVHLVQDRHQEGGRLARARLRARHQIPPGQDDRDRVLLHRRRFVVACQLYVIIDNLCQLNVVEGIDVAGHVVARRLHGNIFVLAEIDTGVAVFEQLRLQTLVPLGEHCVVDLAASGSTATAAVSSASGAATAAVAPIGTTRPASATAVRSTIVERSATGGCSTGPFTGAGSATAADAARSGRAHCRSRLRPAIILRRPVHGSITANGCRSATRTTTSATVRPPVVVPPIASETFRILIAPAVPAALEATAIVVAPVATAAAIVAVVAAAPIVLIAAATAASATPVEVASAIVTIAVAPEVAAATIPVRIAVSTPSATSATDTAAAYRTNAGTGISRLKVATAISTFSQLRWYVPPGRMLRISGFWVAATAAAKLLLLLLQVQTSKLHLVGGKQSERR